MMKKILCIVLVLCSMLSLAACGCEHAWLDATCTEPMTCAKCGETEGETAEHLWKDATYTEPKTCAACGLTEGEPLEDPNEGILESEIYQAVVAMTASNMGNYNPEWEYDRATGTFYLYMTAPDGIAAGLAANPEALYDTWQKVVDNMAQLSGTIQNGFNSNGYQINCELILKSDADPDKSLLEARNGATTYNIIEELM